MTIQSDNTIDVAYMPIWSRCPYACGWVVRWLTSDNKPNTYGAPIPTSNLRFTATYTGLVVSVVSLNIFPGFHSQTAWYRVNKMLKMMINLRPNQKICVFTVTCQKNLGSVGINIFFFLLSAKPEIVVPGSGIRFRYFIFEISDKTSFVEAVLWRVTQFFYLIFALNFDKKLAVE